MVSNKKKFKILVLNTLSTGLEIIDRIIEKKANISGIVSFEIGVIKKDNVSGWVDMKPFCTLKKIKLYKTTNYSLNSIEDRNNIQQFEYNIIFVVGWQRLIPKWLIDSAKYGAIGVHGSPYGINLGRGRSPQNWSIMLREQFFFMALFIIKEGIDDGPVLIEEKIEYNQFDDISSSYKKTSLLVSDMFIKIINQPKILNNSKPQNSEPFYFPQRIPSDGIVDWNLSQLDIHAHCRALSRPYPGLFTLISGKKKLIIWECVPFNNKIENVKGKITEIFYDKTFLVSCGDGIILIKNYSIETSTWFPKKNFVFLNQSLKLTLDKIINRHKLKYPNLTISSSIRNKYLKK